MVAEQNDGMPRQARLVPPSMSESSSHHS